MEFDHHFRVKKWLLKLASAYSLSSVAPGWETTEKTRFAEGVSLPSSSSGVGGLQLDKRRWASASASFLAWLI